MPGWKRSSNLNTYRENVFWCELSTLLVNESDGSLLVLSRSQYDTRSSPLR